VAILCLVSSIVNISLLGRLAYILMFVAFTIINFRGARNHQHYLLFYIISFPDALLVCSCVFSTIDFLPALFFTRPLFPIQSLFGGHIRSCNYLSNVFVTGSSGGQMLLIYQIMDVL
jgi:hypothetical protein